MKWFHRAALAFGVVGVVTAGAVANPTWVESIGVDVWNVPALHDHFERERRVELSLEERGQVTLQRAWRRSELIDNILNERITFAEAIDLNLEISKSNPEALQRLHSMFPGTTEREKSAHQLVRQVDGAVDPRGKPLAQMFECEMATMTFE